MFYYGDVNRLSTDPQTRNYIQDNMGMAFIKPKNTRQAYISGFLANY
ncbi:MAG: cellobionic acid phosphorylase [Colwellia sp.]|jgi:cellobionic acid phosphorylase